MRTVAPLRLRDCNVSALRLNSENHQIATKLGQVRWGVFEYVAISGPPIEVDALRFACFVAQMMSGGTVLLDKLLQDFRVYLNVLAKYLLFGSNDIRT